MRIGVSVAPMSDSNPSKAVPVDRRSVLATLGTTVATGLAGCGGGNGGGDDRNSGGGDSTGTDSDTGGDNGASETDTGGSDGTQSGDCEEAQSTESNCPAVPSSYTRADIPATVADETLATIGVPGRGP